MLCSSCGSKIPFTGKVCPNCLRDKADDQAIHSLFFMCGGLGMMLGWLTSDYFGLSFVQWFFFAPLIGMAVALVIVSATAKERKSQAPEVRPTDRRG